VPSGCTFRHSSTVCTIRRSSAHVGEVTFELPGELVSPPWRITATIILSSAAEVAVHAMRARSPSRSSVNWCHLDHGSQIEPLFCNKFIDVGYNNGSSRAQLSYHQLKWILYQKELLPFKKHTSVFFETWYIHNPFI